MAHYIDNYFGAFPSFLKQNEDAATRIVIVEKWKPNPPNPWLNSSIWIEEFKKDMDYFRAKMFNSVGIPSKYFEI